MERFPGYREMYGEIADFARKPEELIDMFAKGKSLSEIAKELEVQEQEIAALYGEILNLGGRLRYGKGACGVTIKK